MQTLTDYTTQAVRRKPKRSAVDRQMSPGIVEPPVVASPPRLAVVIGRRKHMGRRAWRTAPLARYGIVQTWRIGLRAAQWQSAAAGGALARRFRARVTASLFFWPDVIVVLGQGNALDDLATRAEQCRVRRVVRELAQWRMPVEILGLCTTTESGPSAPPLRLRELIRSIPAPTC
ncbi:MAG TPA: hypothetical protein VN541_00180 [Tepidisphaeraceae bacterium]|nr:hypothetical protein [Tepidisphaeraceae bacterium]